MCRLKGAGGRLGVNLTVRGSGTKQLNPSEGDRIDLRFYRQQELHGSVLNMVSTQPGLEALVIRWSDTHTVAAILDISEKSAGENASASSVWMKKTSSPSKLTRCLRINRTPLSFISTIRTFRLWFVSCKYDGCVWIHLISNRLFPCFSWASSSKQTKNLQSWDLTLFIVWFGVSVQTPLFFNIFHFCFPPQMTFVKATVNNEVCFFHVFTFQSWSAASLSCCLVCF